MSVIKKHEQEIICEAGYLTRDLYFTEAKKLGLNEWVRMPQGTGFNNCTTPFSKILYFLRGEGKITIDDKEFVVKAGSVAYVPPNTTFSLIATKGVIERIIVNCTE